MAPSTPFQARVRVTLRWRDLDMLGHMNQSVYHELLEEGRAALFEEVGRLGDFSFVIARVELDYRSEVRKDHGFVDVVVRPASIGRSSLIVDQAVVLPDGTVAAEGRAVLVAWDPAGRRSRTFTDGERTKLQSLIA
jgi:acyl-CoA thioester hydrolase